MGDDSDSTWDTSSLVGSGQAYSRVTRIGADAINALEREGLADIVNQFARILDSDGLEKYGVQGWRNKSDATHREKQLRHADQCDLDDDSGCEPQAHAALRSLIRGQLSLEARR